VTRAGARPGDLLAVAGVLGHAAAGLALLGAGLAGPGALVTAYRWPRPPYQAGPEAAALGATSMIDISDGLVADTGHVARASGVLIDIDTARLAPGSDLLAAAARLGGSAPPGRADPAAAARPAGNAGPGDHVEPAGLARPLVWMLTGGEDHALAATFPPGTGLPAHWRVIGQVRQGEGVRVDGQPFQGQAGWDHFI
jgi:thiamine-monophosphate kinase